MKGSCDAGKISPKAQDSNFFALLISTEYFIANFSWRVYREV
jgi:hypothetical protein